VVDWGTPHARTCGAVVGVSALLGAGIGDGALVATWGCVGGEWWTGDHPTRRGALGSAVVGTAALVGAGIDGGAWGLAGHVKCDGGAMVA
jgi:hypothetical protein